MIWQKHNLGILLLLVFGIVGCGGDESSVPGLPANILGVWSGTLEDNQLVGGSAIFNLNVTRTSLDSSTSVGSVKFEGTFEIKADFSQIPIPEPLSIQPEDQSCLSPSTFSFQSSEVKGNEIIIDAEFTFCLRSNLPPITAPFHLKGTVSGNQIRGSVEIVIINSQAPNGEFTTKGEFVLVNQAGPSSSFENLKNAPLEILGDWDGEWSNDVTKETGTIRASFKEIFVTPDTPLDVLELRVSISLSPSSTQCFSELVDLSSSGEIKGNSFTLKVPFNGQDISINFKGIKENNEVHGTFEIIGTEGACLGHTGTWKIQEHHT